MTPNQVSVASIVFAGVAAWGFWYAGVADARGDVSPFATSLSLLVAAAGIQLRLLCNMLDGLLAVEGGLKTKTGDLFNEIPDRVADVLIFIGAGMAMRAAFMGLTLGVTAAILSLSTAYVRLLGGALGLKQDFMGPMAKQHRMFVLTVGALAGAVEHVVRGSLLSLRIAMVVIVVGAAITIIRRIAHILRQLEAR